MISREDVEQIVFGDLGMTEQVDAILALIQPTVAALEERVQKAEEERDTWKDCIAEEMAENVKLFDLLGVMPEVEAGRAGTDVVVDAVRKLKADLAAALDALSACHRSGMVLEERARNAEALTANLKRLENERAIELMRVKRDLAIVGDAVGGLVQAAEDAHRQGRITAALCAAIADPALAAWRGK